MYILRCIALLFTNDFARVVGFIQKRVIAETRVAACSCLIFNLSFIAKTYSVSVTGLGTVARTATRSPFSPIAPGA